MSSTLTPAHLFTTRGRRRRGFYFFKIALGTRLASAIWKEVNGKPDKINELILKTKALITCNSHLRIVFPFNWLFNHLDRGGGSFKIVRPRSRGWKNFRRCWIRVVRGLENWTIFLDVKCVSPVIEKSFLIDPLTTSNAICRDFN